MLLKAEQHPALIGGERGVQKLTVIQHELNRDKIARQGTSKYDSVVAIFDNILTHPDAAGRKDPARNRRGSREDNSVMAALERTAEEDDDGTGMPGGAPPASDARPPLAGSPTFGKFKVGMSARESLTQKLRGLNTTLSAQRAALDEIKRSLPRPFVRILVPRDKMMAAFERTFDECYQQGTLEKRPIKPALVKRTSSSGFKGVGAPAARPPLDRSKTQVLPERRSSRPPSLERAGTLSALHSEEPE